MAQNDAKELAKELLQEMRTSFQANDWDKALLAFEQLQEMKTDRAVRIETTSLAVRALAATKQRPAARALLRELNTSGLKKPVHYEFLARAYLDIKQYKNAAEACEQAEALRVVEENQEK